MTAISNQRFQTPEIEPHKIRPGVFQAHFYREQTSLFLCMELLTKSNAENWARFQEITWWVANPHTCGILGRLVGLAGTEECPPNDQKQTGFSQEEYSAFIQKAILQKQKTAGKIVHLLEKNGVGSSEMWTSYWPGQLRFIVYVSKNPYKPIPFVEIEDRTLKNYITAYNDILISVGSDFSNERFFHNRGISRNPYWVFEGKYSGLSMLLHGFTGAVAERFFPQKLSLQVRPVGSMQVLIQNALLPGEGYVEDSNGMQKDLKNIKCSQDGPECQTDTIKTSALTRIYQEAMVPMQIWPLAQAPLADM